MRVAPANPSTLLLNVALFVFITTLVVSLRSDKAAPPPSPTHSEKNTNPLYDTSDLPEFILHNLAYLISCISVTVFLLISAAILLGLATVLMELVAETFRSARQAGRDELSRRERARQQQEAELSAEPPLDDIYCDTWNYR